ncbi:conserved protein of unknown function (plasmid) [Rhodovastum atsumiense]|uniref:Uncharacterized protein n=1 Tax=Rhodovastum atsumiense TaxID=504468 RepID=A0A5M6IQ47_9PROT|nr:hypothetical protein [Rhodovastum atsumiense]KAA5609605.1 hypothetical protein F1189_23560 [Rhodovastum atsumiense]CAH2606371.1 conserved protein of unknown function [Rhodovastum atsumiense]
MVSFRRELPPATKVHRLPGALAAAPAGKPASRKVPALTGLPIWWLIGPNGSGKTLVARWMLERAIMAGRAIKAAALDVNSRTLASFFPDGVDQPEAADAAAVVAWMQGYLGYVAQLQVPALLDMGGGDQSLVGLVTSTPDLLEVLAEQRQAAVACYFLTPRPEDLDVLGTLEEFGFRPRNTVLVVNEALVTDRSLFAPILGHADVTAALARGAVLVALPRLFDQDLAIRLDSAALLLGEAGAPTLRDGAVNPLDTFQRAAARAAWRRLEDSFAPVGAWLP